jgi:hypothetical protein
MVICLYLSQFLPDLIKSGCSGTAHTKIIDWYDKHKKESTNMQEINDTNHVTLSLIAGFRVFLSYTPRRHWNDL